MTNCGLKAATDESGETLPDVKFCIGKELETNADGRTAIGVEAIPLSQPFHTLLRLRHATSHLRECDVKVLHWQYAGDGIYRLPFHSIQSRAHAQIL